MENETEKQPVDYELRDMWEQEGKWSLAEWVFMAVVTMALAFSLFMWVNSL